MAPTTSLTFTEPHPRIPTTSKSNRPRAVLGSGRGGAGNYARYDTATLTAGPTASGPARASSVSTTRTSTSSSSTSPESSTSSQSTTTSSPKSNSNPKIFTGIGGAGNAHPYEDRRIFSFDEELERQARLAGNARMVPVFHAGRGGAGNRFTEVVPGSSEDGRGSVRSGLSRGSGGSGGSVRSGDSRVAMERAKRSIQRLRGKLSRAVSRE